MPPKAKGKAKPRITRSCVALPRGSQSGLQARNAARQQALQARPGSYHACPNCAGAVRVSTDAKATTSVRCPIRVQILGNSTLVCDFKTKPHCWRRRALVPDAQATQRNQAVRDSIEKYDHKVRAGELRAGLFWNMVRLDVLQPVGASGQADLAT